MYNLDRGWVGIIGVPLSPVQQINYVHAFHVFIQRLNYGNVLFKALQQYILSINKYYNITTIIASQ